MQVRAKDISSNINCFIMPTLRSLVVRYRIPDLRGATSPTFRFMILYQRSYRPRRSVLPVRIALSRHWPELSAETSAVPAAESVGPVYFRVSCGIRNIRLITGLLAYHVLHSWSAHRWSPLGMAPSRAVHPTAFLTIETYPIDF